MKKTNLIVALSLLTVGLQALATTALFEEMSQSTLDRFGMTLGKQEQVQLKGSDESGNDCSITVINSSKISQAFPESSKQSQNIQISMQTKNLAVNFKLKRDSDVKDFSSKITAGASILNVSAYNKTGIGNGMMKQTLEIIRTVGPHKSLTMTVSDFSGEKLTCTAK